MQEEAKSNPDLDELQQLFRTVEAGVRMFKYPTEELNQLIEMIREAMTSGKLESNEEYREFICKKIAPVIMSKLANSQSYDQSFVLAAANFHEVMIEVFYHEISANRFDSDFSCAMTWAFSPDKPLYQRNFQISPQRLKELTMRKQSWRSELKVGENVDVKIECNAKGRVEGWAQGRIDAVDGDSLSIMFPLLPTYYDQEVDRWSTDLAQFESKTKKDYEWRKANLANLDVTDFVVDMHDDLKWEEGTIFDVSQDMSDGRPVLVGNCGFRVYRESRYQQKKDERGYFDGWSKKYDEYIPVFSPRIQAHLSKVNGIDEDEEEDESQQIDDLIEPMEGHSRVYAVPRVYGCTSQKFIENINKFAHLGGYDKILNLFEGYTADEKLGLSIMGHMVSMFSMPSKIYHRDYLQEMAPKYAAAIKGQVLRATDKAFKVLTPNDISQIQISFNVINQRIYDKEEATLEQDKFKLEISKKGISTELLEKRIVGIKELNKVLQSSMQSWGPKKSITTEMLIQWMTENGVFGIIWDAKRTHAQLVQRSNEIFKALAKQKLLSRELLQKFWALSKDDYKSEVFKIIGEAAIWLDDEHIEYLFNEITQTPAAKLSLEDFDAISDLGKNQTNADFKAKTSAFFWDIITKPDLHKAELIENCTAKFAQMVQYWPLDQKKPYFDKLVECLKSGQVSIVPVLRLFNKIIKSGGYTSSYNVSNNNYGMGQNQGSSIYNNNQDVEDPSDQPEKKNYTIRTLLNELIEENGLADSILKNLGAYIELVATQDSASLLGVNRHKLFVASKTLSHHEEVRERLQFLQEMASKCDFNISKAHLKVIYDLLTQSPVESDYEYFMHWCNLATKSKTASQSVLSLDEVGDFFADLRAANLLNLEKLPIVGFNFLKQYFVSQNEEHDKMVRVKVATKPKTTTYTSYYNNRDDDDDDQDEESVDTVVNFASSVHPEELTNIQMVWDIALDNKVSGVVDAAITFLVNCYISIGDELEERRSEILQEFCKKCFAMINEKRDDVAAIKRIVRILSILIELSERKGTAGVQPHNAILLGEKLDRIIVRYMVRTKDSGYYYATLKLAKKVTVSAYTSATVWEFKSEVAKMLGLAPKYLKIQLANNKLLQPSQHGMTLQELNIRNGDILTAELLAVTENIKEAPIVDRIKRCLTPAAQAAFTEVYSRFSDKNTGIMDVHGVAGFVSAATSENCSETDPRVSQIIQQNGNPEKGELSCEGFMNFYYEAASGANLKVVKENLKKFNYRLDLKHMSEVVEEVDFQKHEMPRYTLSANDEQFQALFGLLDKNDDASSDVWNLVRMLATNANMYQEVLSLQSSGGSTNWTTVFEDKSLYKQIYKQEIIRAVLESGKSTQSKRVWEEGEDTLGQAASGQDEEEEKMADAEPEQQEDAKQAELDRLKANWTNSFLENEGLNYVLNSFLDKKIKQENANTLGEQASLKDVAFMAKLLSIFLEAGIAASPSYTGISNASEHLVSLMARENSQSLINSIDYDRLVIQALELLSDILQKKKLIIEDKIIVESCLGILDGVLSQQKCVGTFLGFQSQSGEIKDLDSLTIAGILNQEDKVRSEFKSFLARLPSSIRVSEHNLLYYLLGVMARNFSMVSGRPSRQYFELFNDLIDTKAYRDQHADGQVEDSSAIYNPEDLLNQIIDKIKESKAKSEAAAEDDGEVDEVTQAELQAEQERLLVGLVTLTGKIIAKADTAMSDRIIQEKDLIGQIFKEFLFSAYFKAQEEQTDSDQIVLQQQQGSRKTQNTKKSAGGPGNKSREAAYELLHQLIKNSEALMKTFIIQQLSPLIATIKKPKGWNYQPQTKANRYQQYVGLVNLGCICYMNSMMQQFFMTPAFRYNLLCVDDGKPEELKEYKMDTIDDNMMHQLQRLIAHLELSERSDYNPKAFCFAFKEFDGTPTNTSEQKDSQEFLNVLFDRLEDALKPTPRKYLVNGVFGGKQCSQMVCTECGKVKNRMEDYLTLSLPVKGVKSIEESLAKQIEGEIISDYQCDGCNRKVDLKKRTMIASTPNVLIVHLQRICFNFTTFQNDKVNSYCSFPNVLDLKPYSFHEVMAKEGRLKEQLQDEDGEAEQNQQQMQGEVELTEEELAKKKEEEEERAEPDRDDCYEYKLVGVNVHSGTANAGHYWSYINTNRGSDPKGASDEDWMKTEKDPWMEFNDSRVSDWDFEDLKSKTFGNEQKASSLGFQSSFGDSYGTSAYMLFYERRQKRDLKIVVPEAEVETQKAKGVEVQFDEENKEHFKMSPYRKAADGELAGSIYKQVAEDNMKFNFESDIFSQEFFDFILQILQSIAEVPVDALTKLHGLQIGTKVGFEILARMFITSGIDNVSRVMIEILHSNTSIIGPFLRAFCEQGEASVLWEILFDCQESQTRQMLAQVITYALCHLKVAEKDAIMAKETKTVVNQFIDTDGVSQFVEEEQPKSVFIIFMTKMIEQLSGKALTKWRNFDEFLAIFFNAMVMSAEDLAAGKKTYDNKSEEYKLGVEYYFIYDMIYQLGDFLLGQDSPYNEPGTIRTNLGNSYQSPNTGSILKILFIMVSERDLIEKYPLNEKQQQVVSHKSVVDKLIQSSEGPQTEEFGRILAEMAYENSKVSKKMAKSYLKQISKTSTDTLVPALDRIKQFLQIKDSLKRQRMEWIFGLPQIISKPSYRTKQMQYGIEHVDLITDDYYTYKCANMKGVIDGYLGQLVKCKGRMDTQCIVHAENLINMMIDDEEIARYIFNQPAPNLQYARFSDWLYPYITYMQEKTLREMKNSALDYYKKRLVGIESVLENKARFEENIKPLIEESEKKLADLSDEEFEGYKIHSLAEQVPKVITSYPPAYIIGEVTGDTQMIAFEQQELVDVLLEEVPTQYMYSNPDGLYNLSVTEKKYRNPTTYVQLSYQKWKLDELKKEAEEKNDGSQPSIADIEFKKWDDDCLTGNTMLRVIAKSKASRAIRITIKLNVEDDETKNIELPISELKANIYAHEKKQVFCFTKTDPSKEAWGKVTMEVSSSVVQMGGTGGSTWGSGYNQNSYSYSSNINSDPQDVGYSNYNGGMNDDDENLYS